MEKYTQEISTKDIGRSMDWGIFKSCGEKKNQISVINDLRYDLVVAKCFRWINQLFYGIPRFNCWSFHPWHNNIGTTLLTPLLTYICLHEPSRLPTRVPMLPFTPLLTFLHFLPSISNLQSLLALCSGGRNVRTSGVILPLWHTALHPTSACIITCITHTMSARLSIYNEQVSSYSYNL